MEPLSDSFIASVFKSDKFDPCKTNLHKKQYNYNQDMMHKPNRTWFLLVVCIWGYYVLGGMCPRASAWGKSLGEHVWRGFVLSLIGFYCKAHRISVNMCGQVFRDLVKTIGKPLNSLCDFGPEIYASG